MNPHRTKATVIALIAAAGMFPAFAPSVQAQPLVTPALSQFQRAQVALENRITARQVQLVLLGTEIADVTTSDRAALGTIITNEQTALVTDYTNAQAATTDAQLAVIEQAMINDERVYLVVTAQTNLVMAADNDSVVETGYTGLAGEISPLVSELNRSRAAVLLANINAEVTAATSLTTGVSADALALTPAGYPANETQIKTYTAQLGEVSHDLGVARVDVKAIEAIALGAHGVVLKQI
jgi:hypothetical protein